MITTTSNWQAKNTATAKMPMYVLSIAGQATAYSTHDLTGVTGAPTFEQWLKVPTGASQSIDVLNGTSSIGEMQLEVIDPAGAVRALVGAGGLEGSVVTLRVGYPGLVWSDYAVVQTYVLYKINVSPDYTSFYLVCRDAQVLQKKTIYVHPENAERLSTDNPWYLGGGPVDVYLQVVLFALGLAPASVDLAGLAALNSPAENIYAPWRPFLFEITDSFEALQFLETEVLKPSGMYQVVLADGTLSLRSMRAPAAGPSVVFTFTEDNLVELPKMDRLAIVNEAVWQFDDSGSGGAANELTVVNATSLTTYGRGNQFTVTSKGLRARCGAFAFAEWVCERMFARFAGVTPGIPGGAVVLDCKAFHMSLPVWVGDYVELTHPLLPDVTSGALGVTARVFEVIDRKPDYAGGVMSYKLLDTGLTGRPAAYEFGAASARPLVIGTSPVY